MTLPRKQFLRLAAGATALLTALRRIARPLLGTRNALSKPTSMQEATVDSYRRLQRVFWVAHKAVTAVAWILGVTFLWLQWRSFLDPNLFDGISKTILIKLGMGLYYFSWIFAAKFDLNLQESVYLIDPSEGTLPRSFFWLTPLFLIGAAFLLWAADHETYLAIFLSLFFVIDCVLWSYTRAWSLPIAAATRERRALTPDRYFHVEKIDVVAYMMCGNYQIYRHIGLFVLLVVFDMIVVSIDSRTYASSFISRYTGISQQSVYERLPAIALFVYVCVCEGSMWFMRAKARLSIHIIDGLQAKYELSLR
ncbi:hypothetical protein [Bradyrhizobium sp. WSM4349]|uniref:hypothetical protein n=1 Tax=Bradyrhizobium sp. WSM4349 TaxID=1040988 RepID=UPI0012F99977|nr:hypothetical protein [Bradyrhizobium sp. WSM4349]